MSANSDLLVKVNAALSDMIDHPKTDYTIGDTSVSAGQRWTQLIELKKWLEDSANVDADICSIPFDYDISEFGEDNTEYEE